MTGLGIKYAVANVHREAQASREAVAMYWKPAAVGGFFDAMPAA